MSPARMINLTGVDLLAHVFHSRHGRLALGEGGLIIEDGVGLQRGAGNLGGELRVLRGQVGARRVAAEVLPGAVEVVTVAADLAPHLPITQGQGGIAHALEGASRVPHQETENFAGELHVHPVAQRIGLVNDLRQRGIATHAGSAIGRCP